MKRVAFVALFYFKIPLVIRKKFTQRALSFLKVRNANSIMALVFARFGLLIFFA